MTRLKTAGRADLPCYIGRDGIKMVHARDLTGEELDWAVGFAMNIVRSDDRFKRNFVGYVLGEVVAIPDEVSNKQKLEKEEPCPFCRREEANAHYDHKYDTHYVRCNNFMCNTRGPSAGSRETAISLWNKQGG